MMLNKYGRSVLSKCRHLVLFVFFCYSTIEASSQSFSRFRFSYRDDPSSTAVIGWCGSRNAFFYVDTVSHGDQWDRYSAKFSVTASNHYKGLDNNFVRLTHLRPGTRYYFRLRDTLTGEKSRVYSFRTLPKAATALLIVAGGDSRNSIRFFEMSPRKCRKGLQDGNRLVSKIVPDVVLFGGDFVLNRGVNSSKKEWGRWFDDWQLTITPDGLLVPIIPAQGNHEDAEDLVQLFDMPPTNGTYAHRLGGDLLSLITLNDNDSVAVSKQVEVVSRLIGLNAPTTDWQMVQYHVPMNPQGTRYGKRQDLIDAWAPLFQQWGVDLVSESHAHILKTTYPLTLETTNRNRQLLRNDTMGSVFIGEGAWGAPLRKMRAADSTIFCQAALHGFHLLQVTRDSVVVSMVSFANVDRVAQNPSDRTSVRLPENLQLVGAETGRSVVILRRKRRW